MRFSNFEIIPPQTSYMPERCSNPSFSVSAIKSIPIMFASMSIVLSISAVEPYTTCDHQLVFNNIESVQNDLSTALREDYEAQINLVHKLELLKESLKDNWDMEGGTPIEERVYDNAKAAILATPGFILKSWRLFPSPNGTLLFSPKSKAIAGISIGNEMFSYAAFVSDDKQISGVEPFDEQTFRFAMEQIHRILEYA